MYKEVSEFDWASQIAHFIAKETADYCFTLLVNLIYVLKRESELPNQIMRSPIILVEVHKFFRESPDSSSAIDLIHNILLTRDDSRFLHYFVENLCLFVYLVQIFGNKHTQTNCLMRGLALVQTIMKQLEGSRDPFVYEQFEKQGCLDVIEELQYHKNMNVYSKANEIIKFLNEETES